MSRASMVCLAILALTPAHGLSEPGPDYVDPPQELRDEVAGIVADMFEDGNANRFGGEWSKLVLRTVADGVERRFLSNTLNMSRHLAETARTDKQTGGTASSAGSTSLVEKPGLPMFLALAVEHGAVRQEVDGTNLTLSVSPFGLFRPDKDSDDPADVQRLQAWRRFAVSVTFNLEGAETVDVAGVDPRQITEYSARLRILGDRSGSSSNFAEKWKETVQPVIRERLRKLTELLDQMAGSRTELRDRMDAVRSALRAELKTFFEEEFPGLAESDREAAKARLEAQILATLWTEILVPVRDGTLALSEVIKKELPAGIEDLNTLKAQEEAARRELGALLEEINSRSLVTAELTNHRADVGSGYSELKLLFERRVKPFDVVLNAGYSRYSDPDPALGQSDTRDYHLSFSVEGSAANPFNSNPNDLSRVTFSLSGRVERRKEIDENIAIAMLRTELPINAGMSLPLSISWANRTELIDEENVSGHIGVSFDMDKLFAMTRSLLSE